MSDTADMFFYHYRFRFGGGQEKEFRLALDRHTLNLLSPGAESCPSWAELAFCRCDHCLLEAPQNKYCPAAASLSGVVKAFGSAVSYEKTDILIETAERTYAKHTTLQKGLSSLVGILMVTSGCPVMEKLKPMVRFHLPFADETETKYRVMSMYLLAQFFRKRLGKEADWEMKDLVRIYENVRLVNRGIAKRLSGIKIEDASVNSLLILDCFADAVNFSLNREQLADLEALFGAHLK